MASVHPAMKGKFGSTEYFMSTMKARDVAKQLVILKEMPDWEDLGIEERFHREIDYNRVRKQIAPYLSNDPDRFFGALIVSVFNHERMKFESASNKFHHGDELYADAAEAFGFLILSGGELLVPLDGQHRLVALRAALSDNDEKQKKTSEVAPNPELANDDLMLIMIRHDAQKSRRIFNKVKKRAGRASRAR